MTHGSLVISLDFELLWGVFDKVSWEKQEAYFLNTRQVIPEILKCFDNHNISCTWATVGMLFNENWDEWNENSPLLQPGYKEPRLSAYKFGKKIQFSKTEKLCFAPDLIKLIKETPKQEVATHTYSHYYCLEPGQTEEHFKADIQMAVNLASKFGSKLTSLVFPRNQYNSSYLEICKGMGIQNIRSNPCNWYWKDIQKDTLLQKIFRTSDAYLGPMDKSYNLKKESTNGLLEQRASRFFRPVSGVSVLNKLRLKRVLKEMEESAKKGEIYHLWWHPHNFGSDPVRSMEELNIIARTFNKLNQQYGFQSKNMDELAQS
ncbi:polysaccharide deacetylase family protein [Gramella sp. KN1008]|uniref:polysaccharide deacetylase family protein n=1 Tax=Gramella sp. KN1008 TaxID=2529298 RepID=UPI00103C035F|nr:polysaccharide deacetylase family protein [Gramella sp. KN1008]TBW25599.1 polysaccharide deacetylase [Gramella sp. KN1008]